MAFTPEQQRMIEYHERWDKVHALIHTASTADLQIYLTINIHAVIKRELKDRATLAECKADTQKWQKEHENQNHA